MTSVRRSEEQAVAPSGKIDSCHATVTAYKSFHRPPRPELKVLAATGVTETGQTMAVKRLGARAVIRKPFASHRLLCELRAILDEREAPAAGDPGKCID